MGCGCGGKANKTVSNLGTIPSNPMIFGEDDADLPIKRVVMVQASGGVPAGGTRFVRGSEVDSMIDSGVLRLRGVR